jgi:transposase-like protein
MLRFNKGDDYMARPAGTKNVMRTPEEKEKLVLEYFDCKVGYKKFAESKDIHPSIFSKWIRLYRANGIEGLKSKTGKTSKPNNGKYNRNKSEIEKLKEELLKKEIELMRLKKGYMVKGVGAKKEYVSISDMNIK